MSKIFSLPIAVRVYPDLQGDRRRLAKPWKRPEGMLVWDAETRVDETQRFMFGSYRFIVGNQCLEEALICADDLSDQERKILGQYASASLRNAGDTLVSHSLRRGSGYSV